MKIFNKEIENLYNLEKHKVNRPLSVLSHMLKQDLNENQIEILKELMVACYLNGLITVDAALREERRLKND